MKEKIYIGSYSDNIKVCEFSNGKLKIVNEIKGIENPSYLHVNKGILYAVSEKQKGSIASFKMEGNNLKILNIKEINQVLPCYINTNMDRKSLLVANYESGSIILYDIEKDGKIGKVRYIKKYKNANMHFAKFFEGNIYAIDLGNNAIYIYDSQMELISLINIPEFYGPRHMVIGKDKNIIYVVTELSNKILVYKSNRAYYNLVQEISTLHNSKIKSFAGAIKISRDNKNIYVTNRGHNSISVFSVIENRLKLIQNISTYGDFPRDILLNETEKYVIVANQKSNNVIVYKRDLNNGMLSKLENADVSIEKPSCIVRSKYEV